MHKSDIGATRCRISRDFRHPVLISRLSGREFCVFHSLLASPSPPHRLPLPLPNPAGRGFLDFSSLLENPTIFWRVLWPLAFPAGSVFRDFRSLSAETPSFAGVIHFPGRLRRAIRPRNPSSPPTQCGHRACRDAHKSVFPSSRERILCFPLPAGKETSHRRL